MNGVFIVGAPRSGTTLLQSILATHTEFFSAPETSFFSRIIPLLGADYYNSEQPINAGDIDTIRRDFHMMTGFEVPVDVKMSPGISVRDAFENLLYGFNIEKKAQWIEKTTNQARCMLAISRYYPDAKFVHIIRDPVDCVASMMSIKPTSIVDYRISYVTSYYELARLWRRCITSVLHYPHQHNVLHIFYEDLVLRPRKVLTEVCHFLGVPFEDTMLNVFHRTAESLFSEKSCPWQKRNLIAGFHADAIHKWRKKLSPCAIWLIQRYIQDLAHYLGYYETVEIKSMVWLGINIAIDQVKLFISVTRIEKPIRRLLGKMKK